MEKKGRKRILLLGSFVIIVAIGSFALYLLWREQQAGVLFSKIVATEPDPSTQSKRFATLSHKYPNTKAGKTADFMVAKIVMVEGHYQKALAMLLKGKRMYSDLEQEKKGCTARCYRLLNKHKEAKAYYDEAINHRGMHKALYMEEKAEYLCELNDLEEALVVYKDLAQRFPTYRPVKISGDILKVEDQIKSAVQPVYFS